MSEENIIQNKQFLTTVKYITDQRNELYVIMATKCHGLHRHYYLHVCHADISL